MHFALPPRKTSHPPPYARAAARVSSSQRRKHLQSLSYVVLGALTLYLALKYILSLKLSNGDDNGNIEGKQDIVIVTVFDEQKMSKDAIRMVKANRDDYAARHGYKNFYTDTSAYVQVVDQSPSSWSVIPALRHAITVHPQSTFFWSLSANALIMNPALSLESHILHRLDSLMLKDVPVVPPDSVIHTFSHLRPSRTHLILSQDMDNLAHTSFLLRNTPSTPTETDNWAYYFLDAWFDPLYRSYAFQKAENHALEHLIQWHPTILAKMVLIEQRLINSYNFATPPVVLDEEAGDVRTHDSLWQEGDLLINFKGCDETEARDCGKEMREYFQKWEAAVENLGGSSTA